MENEEKHSINPLLASITLLAIVALIAAGYFYYKYQKANKLLNNNQTVSAEEAKKIVDKISKFYNLPSDETPNVATVLDVTKLQDQPFFKNAKNDDKVLIYQKAQIAILYRPSENKIIQITSVTGIPSPSPTSTQESKDVEAPSPKVSETPKATVAP